MRYSLLAHPRAQRELDGLPTIVAQGIRSVLEALAVDPRSRRFDLKQLRGIDGEPPAQRLRIGEYRVVLRIDHRSREIRIARIGHRSDVYRGVEHLDE